MAKGTTAAAVCTYEVLIGLNYPTAKGEARAEIGDIAPSKKLPALPEQSIPHLLDMGAIRRVDEPADEQPEPPADGDEKTAAAADTETEG